VGEALLGVHTPFKRTPKYNLHNYSNAEKYLDYLLPKDGSVWIELLMGFYAFGLLFLAVSRGVWGLAFWLSLFSGGYAYIVVISFKQSFAGRQPKPSSSAKEAYQVSSQATSANTGQD
jgi:hypothetical protein